MSFNMLTIPALRVFPSMVRKMIFEDASQHKEMMTNLIESLQQDRELFEEAVESFVGSDWHFLDIATPGPLEAWVKTLLVVWRTCRSLPGKWKQSRYGA